MSGIPFAIYIINSVCTFAVEGVDRSIPVVPSGELYIDIRFAVCVFKLQRRDARPITERILERISLKLQKTNDLVYGCTLHHILTTLPQGTGKIYFLKSCCILKVLHMKTFYLKTIYFVWGLNNSI